MALRASSVGSGRATRSSSVCQMRSMFSARRRSVRRRSVASGWSRSSATLRSLVRTERRAASVGWAVKTGRTPRLRAVWARCSGSASLSMSAVRARMPPSAARRARSSRPRWTCSVTLARWKYVEKARTSLVAVARSVSPRSRAAASPSDRVRARTRSTRSSSSSPSWRTRVSPRRSPRRRISARRAVLSLAASSVGVVADGAALSALLTGAAPCSGLGGASRPGPSRGRWRATMPSGLAGGCGPRCPTSPG